MQPSNTELILIRVTGEDRPGLTASVTEILAKYDATILDIGQADIHNTLSPVSYTHLTLPTTPYV